MKILKKSFVSRARLMFNGALFAFLFAGFAVQSEAQIYTLSQNDSSVQVDLGSGVSNWQVDGVNQLNLQWFYYRVGSSGPENPISSIASPSGTSINSSMTRVGTTYANSTISVKTTYSLTGQTPGTGQATLTELITVLNPLSSGQTIDFHFYQYSDFNLGGVPGGQSVQFYNNGSSTYYEVIQTGATGSLIETANAPAATGFEVQAGSDGTLLGLLTDGFPTTLNNNLAAGPGNVNYAYEWDATLAPGSSFQISKIISVPEPSSLALISSGMLALALMQRRRRGV
jgi:hypothetical protein